MRKGSTSLGSLGGIPTGIALLILPLALGASALSPALAASKAKTEEEQRAAVQRRTQWLNSTRPTGVESSPARDRVLRVIHTRATWYGPGFHGRRTASGERFNQHALTLASRHLPFGTRVRVVNLKTGKSAIGRVNDRGPFVRGYTADLSQALARKIGMGGSAPVRLEILGKAKEKPAPKK